MRSVKGTATFSNTAQLTLATNATGGSKIKAWIDGAEVEITTGAGHTPAVSAAALKAAADTALAGMLGDYSTTVDGAGGLTVTRTDNAAATLSAATLSADATQTISCVDWRSSTKVLDGATAMGAGDPQTQDSALSFPILRGDGYSPIHGVAVSCMARLFNGSGGAKTARWRLAVWSPVWGHYFDPEVDSRLVTQTDGEGFTDDAITVQVDCGSRVAMVLRDDGAGAALTGVGVQLDGWIAVS